MALHKKHLGLIFYTGIAVVLFFVFKESVNTELVYHQQQPVFLGTLDDAFSSLLHYRGFVNYISSLFVELCYYPIVGALSLAIAVTVLLASITALYGHRVQSTLVDYLLFVSTLLVVVAIVATYNFELSFVFSLLLSLLLANIFISIFKKGKRTTLLLLIMLLLAVPSYVLLGGAGYLLLIFAVVVSIPRVADNKRNAFLCILALLGLAIFVPFLSSFILYPLSPLPNLYFSELVEDAYTNPKVTLLYRLLAALFVLMAINRIYRLSFLHINKKLVSYSLGGVCVVIVACASFFIVNKEKRARIELDWLAYNRQWESVLNTKLTGDDGDSRVDLFYKNRALAASDGLVSNAFIYSQKYGEGGLYINRGLERSFLMPTSDLYYQLGFINEARHFAHEAFSVFEANARVLRRLVEVNIINGNYVAASKYIMLLKKSPVNRKWAKTQELLINSPEALKKCNAYTEKIDNLPTEDFFSASTNLLVNLEHINDQNKCNKVAFEYLVSSYLFNHNIAELLNLVPQFREYGYAELPQSIQEAILIYVAKTGDNVLDLAGYKLSDNVKRLFSNYSRDYMAYRKGEKSQAYMKKEYASSYCYYIHFVSPSSNKKQNAN